MPDATNPLSNPLNGDLNLGGNRARNAVPSLTDDHYVTRGELGGIVSAVLAAAYLLRSGANPMTGNLNGGNNKGQNFAPGAAAGELLTYQQAVLLAATTVQVLAGKLRTPATVDGDDDLTLVTKAWMLSKVTAGLTLPTQSVVRNVGFSTWTVPAGVYRLYIWLTGGGGGAGGYGDGLNGYNGKGGNGGPGARLMLVVNVTPGQILRIRIGSGGGNGTYDGIDEGSGGGGGGGSTIYFDNAGADGALLASAGGGGGGAGGAEGNNGLNGAPGGNAAQPGGNGYRGTGGVAGTGSSLNAGLGGAVNGLPGNAGSKQVGAGATDVDLEFLFPGALQGLGGTGFINQNGTPGNPGQCVIRY